ncbi:MAG: ABC transporter permease, partial [Candidatus Halalkalibacterium sp. M3_1C_030]
LGFDSDQLVSVRVNDPQLSKQGDVIRQKFLQLASVQAVTQSSAPVTGRFSGSRFVFPSDTIPDKKYTFSMPRIDEHFLETMDIDLVAGRNMRPNVPDDSSRIMEALMNETGVKTLGFTEYGNIIGEIVANRYRIVGVTEDFHLESLQNEIEPAILGFNPFNNTYVVTARLAGGSISDGLQDMQAVWEDELGAENAFDYTFVDDQIQQQYEQEQNTAKVIGIFAGLSIFIASMGLFGLAAFTTQQRYQEIGIRKVLGASISNIIFLLYKDFGKLIVLASIIAIPVIYYTGTKWLENFAYSIEISPIIFGFAILGVVLITLIATGSRSIKAALMNPVDAIRQE